MIVSSCKVCLLISYFCFQPLVYCILCCGFKKVTFDELSDLTDYVLLLQGEVELPRTFLKFFCTNLDKVIQKGAKQKTGKLLQLLSKKDSFNLQHLVEFDSDEVVSIHSESPSRCWSLSITSLTCVVVALPTIDQKEKRKCLKSVREGLSYVCHVEKALDTKKRLENSRKAADIVWNGIDLKNKWLNYNLQGKALKGKNIKEVLIYLGNISEGIVRAFKDSTKSEFMENPINWPEKVIAANSLYRVSQTILLQYQNITSNNLEPDEFIFKKLEAMICDLVVGCLANLPRVIMDKCYSSTIEKREKGVEEAAKLLGATEDVLKFLEGIVSLPTMLSLEDAMYIDNWRAVIKDQNSLVPAVQSNVNITLTRSASI